MTITVMSAMGKPDNNNSRFGFKVYEVKGKELVFQGEFDKLPPAEKLAKLFDKTRIQLPDGDWAGEEKDDTSKRFALLELD